MFENFSVIEFVKAAGAATPFVLPIVLAFVKYLGEFGVEGRWKLLASMLTGVGLGGAVMYFQLYPQLVVEWFAVSLYGFILGLTASGVYDVAKEVAEKGAYRASASKIE